jgi:telomere length regulation protein
MSISEVIGMTDPVRELISALRSSHSDLTSLLSHLVPPLDSLGLLSPTFRRLNATRLPTNVHITPKHISALQRAILEHVAPVWLDALADEGAALLLDQYFCPDAFSFASTAAGQVSCLAYSSILSLPLTEYSVRLLARLAREYPIDRLHVAILTNSDGQNARTDADWEDLIGNVVTVPPKVANALAGNLKGKMTLPSVLEQAAYFGGLSVRCEVMVHSLSSVHAKRT